MISTDMNENLNVNTESSGGTRFSEGKPGGWAYMPLYGLILVSPVSTGGAGKYAPEDWREGQSFSTLYNAMWRHLIETQQHGIWAIDPKTNCYHLAHVAWNLLTLLTFMALGRTDLDDITPWRGVTTAQKVKAEQQAKAEGVPVIDILRREGGPWKTA